ncbi:hypothetical protein [Sphingorhabdus lutea]|uniref:hypothetical protein n=1 Tax=Sphingorhabdus lutea TaxID=1913578 RepID=UPI000AD6D486|nr:hypothetical protein [Sphingorhabdus lutea]
MRGHSAIKIIFLALSLLRIGAMMFRDNSNIFETALHVPCGAWHYFHIIPQGPLYG